MAGKKRLKISKVAEGCKNHLMKNNDDKALQSQIILQTFLWWGQACELSVKFCNFMEQYLAGCLL